MITVLQTDDPAIKIELRDYPISDPLIEKHLGINDDVMVHRADRTGRGHHYRRHRDAGGWYIRMNKRGQVKRYLGRCEVTWIITAGRAEDTIYQFHLEG